MSVAILVDKFISASKQQEAEERLETKQRTKIFVTNTLDPLLEKLSNDYIDDADLSIRLKNLYTV